MKQITLKKNLTSGIIGLVFGAAMWFAIPYCIKAKISIVSSNIGPDYLPRLVAVIMMLCGVGLIFQSVVRKKDETVVIELSKEVRVIVYALALTAYFVLLPIVGFMVSSCLFLCASLFLMECRKPSYYLWGILLVTAIFVGFKYGLSISLPTIIL